VTDLDEPVTGGLYEGGVQIKIPGRQHQHWPYVKFRGVCGAHGYFASASFVDDEAYGGGKTPREALKSLAASLRTLADAVEAAAKETP
jgi:hypothetical protein